MNKKDVGSKLPFNAKNLYNLPEAQLIEKAVVNGEGTLTSKGALRVTTGKFTGRSPNDKFTVKEPTSENLINWGEVNRPISQENFDILYKDLITYLENKSLYVFDGYAGADKEYRLKIRAINELAWQNLFIHQLLIRPEEKDLQDFTPNFTLICAPSFQAIPEKHGTNSETFIIVNFAEKIVMIGGTYYAGEMKKSIFSIANYLLPQKNVLPMHCSANKGKKGDIALFFGLSGTGKTTLSADPDRSLIGDDEHGWSDKGVFNIEGGCYAKCIDLTQKDEPQIWDAIRFGSVLENVELDERMEPFFSSKAITENTRAAYPVEYIPNAVLKGFGGHPNIIIFLTADAFGVLPPISLIEKDQAMYHFLSGYTSKLAGTERGITKPVATFSPCFGSPFLPLPPGKYAEMLGEKIERHNTKVFLINTGWIGGPYGVGNRIKLSYTRAMVSAALKGYLNEVAYTTEPFFRLAIPNFCPGVPHEILNPKSSWVDKEAYNEQASKLAHLFYENFKKIGVKNKELIDYGPMDR